MFFLFVNNLLLFLFFVYSVSRNTWVFGLLAFVLNTQPKYRWYWSRGKINCYVTCLNKFESFWYGIFRPLYSGTLLMTLISTRRHNSRRHLKSWVWQERLTGTVLGPNGELQFVFCQVCEDEATQPGHYHKYARPDSASNVAKHLRAKHPNVCFMKFCCCFNKFWRKKIIENIQYIYWYLWKGGKIYRIRKNRPVWWEKSERQF